MADYDTKAVTIGGVTVTVSKEVGGSAGERLAALLKFIAKWAHAGKPPEGGIDNSLPEGPPGHAGHPLPGEPPKPSTGPGAPTNPIAPGGPPPEASTGGDYISNDLPKWLANNADAVAKAVLKSCFDCNTAQPHK